MSERPYIIGIDFDDTICKNNMFTWATSASDGKPFPKVIEAINKLYDEGNYIIIWTARYIKEDLDDVKSFLTKHSIKYHKLNEACEYIQYKSYPKLFFDTVIDDNCLLNIDWNFIPYYIQVRKNFIPASGKIFTNEMIDYFYNRTIAHINRVKKFTRKLVSKRATDERLKEFLPLEFIEPLYLQVDKHDDSKFSNDIIRQYALLTERMRCHFGREKFLATLPEEEVSEIVNNIKEACKIHYLRSKHHIEYWEAFDKLSSIDNISLIEMCADWCAMSEENRNSPLDYFKANIKNQFNFTEELIYIITIILNAMWEV